MDSQAGWPLPIEKFPPSPTPLGHTRCTNSRQGFSGARRLRATRSRAIIAGTIGGSTSSRDVCRTCQATPAATISSTNTISTWHVPGDTTRHRFSIDQHSTDPTCITLARGTNTSMTTVYKWLTPLGLHTHESLSAQPLILGGRRRSYSPSNGTSAQGTPRAAVWPNCATCLPTLMIMFHITGTCFRQASLHPHDIRSLNDLSRLPITTKRELRAQFPAQVVAANLPPERRRLQKTSGSTGMPFEFYTDHQAQDVWRASRYFFQALAGIKPSDSHIIITSPRPPVWGLREERLRRLLTGSATKYLSVFDFSLSRFMEALHDVSGYYLQGYPSYIARLARELEEQRVRLKSYPKAVFTDSETLTSPEAAQITRGFHCPVFVHYTSFEFQNMALSCPDNPSVMHVNTESILIEVVTEAGTRQPRGSRGA